jgi:glucuronate isomerase
MYGEEVENGELPNDLALIGKTIQDICYNNAKEYFNLQYLDAAQTVTTNQL